jgi:NhaC family Na+:H+ antiporter
MLVRQLCDGCEGADAALALDMESSVALIPALIPWSTSCVGIMAFTGMPLASVLYAFLPMLVPAWILVLSLWVHRHPSFVDGPAARVLGLTVEDDLRRLNVA